MSAVRKAAVAELLDEYLDCRTLHHNFDRALDDGKRLRNWINTATNRRKVFQCGRCEMKRYDVWNRFTGEVLARSYLAPEGYSLSGTVYAKTFRKVWMERFDD